MIALNVGKSSATKDISLGTIEHKQTKNVTKAQCALNAEDASFIRGLILIIREHIQMRHLISAMNVGKTTVR